MSPRPPSTARAFRMRRWRAREACWNAELTWPDRPLIEDKLPRGAGFIALYTDQSCPQDEQLYVCLVTKQSGIESFPKGPRRHGTKETVFAAASRHWLHEAGLNMGRLAVLQDFHVHEPEYGCRCRIADCREPAAGQQQLDSRQWS